jgi:hypothetical protein
MRRWTTFALTLGLATAGTTISLPGAHAADPAEITYCRDTGIVTFDRQYLVGGPNDLLGENPPRPTGDNDFVISKVVCVGSFAGQSEMHTTGFNSCNPHTDPNTATCRRNPLYSTVLAAVFGSPGDPPDSPLNLVTNENFSTGQIQIDPGLVHGVDTGIGCTLDNYGWVFGASGYLPIGGTCSGPTYTSGSLFGYSTSEVPTILFAGAGDAFADPTNACLGDANPTCFNAVQFNGSLEFSNPHTDVPPLD